MKLLIAAVTHRMPDWVNMAVSDYVKRLPADWALEIREVKAASRQAGKTAPQNMAIEADRLRAAIANKPGPKLALDERGKVFTSQSLSDLLVQYRVEHGHVTFVIGGPDGLDPAFKNECDMLCQLSALTLPHAMVRVLLTEQIYRAWSIAHQHPYHRE
jgi:23S rRNA (pseudouridine1915-N3)-methyltransferase